MYLASIRDSKTVIVAPQAAELGQAVRKLWRNSTDAAVFVLIPRVESETTAAIIVARKIKEGLQSRDGSWLDAIGRTSVPTRYCNIMPLLLRPSCRKGGLQPFKIFYMY